MDWLDAVMKEDEEYETRLSQVDVDTIVSAFEKRQALIADYISHESKKPTNN